MKKIIALILAAITTVNGTSSGVINEANIHEYVASDCESVAEFIIDNLEFFADEYNKEVQDEALKFEATSCEKMIPVYVVSTDQEGLYVDFNDNNGYMIIVDDYSVQAFETKGDLEYLKELKYTYYSIYDGFLYLGEDGNYLPFEFNRMSESDLEDYIREGLGKSYNGQSDGTDGCIYSPDAYVKDRYGSGYVVKSGGSKSLNKYEYMEQWDLTIYYKLTDTGKRSEENCVLSSCYSLLNYLQLTGKCSNLSMSSSKTNYYATKDSFYAKYKNRSDYEVETPKSLPNLYLAVRQYAIDNYGYEVSALNPFDIGDIIKGVAKQYGYNLTTKDIIVWTYEDQVVKEINGGNPIIWNMANSTSYGPHSTVVTGYRTYTKTTTVLGINFYSYVQLMQLNDNWENEARYFDFTNYLAIGSFTQVR
ncbi:MAG: hypothetical protein IJE49_06650 [Agathobacter sp.]|nr:hypothetical protein [Agathobacter sp.]